MNVLFRIVLPFTVATSLLLPGCATVDPQVKPDTGVAYQKSTDTAAKPGKKSLKPQKELVNSLQQAFVATPKQNKPTVKISPKLSAELLFRLMTAEVAGQRGNLDVAVQQYVKASQLSQDPRVAERATRISIFARDDQAAFKAAKHWVAVDPGNPEVHQVLGTLWLRNGDRDAAVQHFKKVIELTQSNKNKGFVLVASLLSKERDKTMALSVMQKLVDSSQQNAVAQFAYGQLALVVGELEIAATAINKTLDIRPQWTHAHILRSNILYRQNKKVQALELLVSALQQQADNIDLRMYYARKLIDEKRLNDAREQFELVLEQNEDNVDAIFAVALLSLRTSELDYAEKHFLDLVERKKRVSESSYYLGQIAESREDKKQARHWYSEVNDGNYYINAHIRIAMLMVSENNINEARQYLHSIRVNSAEQELRIYIAEGEALRQVKMYQQAFDHYTEALASMPDNTQLLYARALMADNLNRLDTAEEDLRNILQREPNNAQALNALGYTLADRTDRYAEALDFIERAYRLRPNDAAIIDSLGWIHYRLGDLQQAAKYLKKAFSLVKDPEIAAHLGEVLWVMGDKDSAQDLWQEALHASPKHDILLDVIERFTK